jgi:hypothetical protein
VHLELPSFFEEILMGLAFFAGVGRSQVGYPIYCGVRVRVVIDWGRKFGVNFRKDRNGKRTGIEGGKSSVVLQ